MLSAVQIQNLLYLVGALVVATVVSALIVLRHRKPKSLEAGIESFSRELKALAPEQRLPPREPRPAPGFDGDPSQRRRSLRARPIVRSTAGRPGRRSPAPVVGSPTVTTPGSNAEAGEPVEVDDGVRPQTADEGLTQKDSPAPAAPRPTKGAHFPALDEKESDRRRRQGG
jgi:hypothetical protein